MKLNLGCGSSKIDGYVNVDKYAVVNPDVVQDLETFPWPWADNSVEQVLLSHVLEHIGETTAGFLGFMKELYRVCAHDAEISITVPHPQHSDFLSDPTHVRPITPATLELFSQKKNHDWDKMGAANTRLAFITQTDFEVVKALAILDPQWGDKLKNGSVTQEEVDQAVRERLNVAKEFQITLRVVKDAQP